MLNLEVIGTGMWGRVASESGSAGPMESGVCGVVAFGGYGDVGVRAVEKGAREYAFLFQWLAECAGSLELTDGWLSFMHPRSVRF